MKEPKYYILSPNYELYKAKEFFEVQQIPLIGTVEKKGFQKTAKDDSYILYNKNKKRQYIINPIIKRFLSFFNQKEGNTFKTVVWTFADLVDCAVGEVVPTFIGFMDDMVKKKILIPVEEKKEVIVRKKFTTVFQVGELVRQWKIVRLMNAEEGIEAYEARKLTDNTTVVLKVLRHNTLEKAVLKEKIKDLRQEFNIMKDVGKHENICRFYDFVHDEEHTFSVMEYVKGKNPRKIAKYGKPKMKLNQRLWIIEQMIQSISHLHQKQMTHGDIHASNFIVTDDCTVKLIDFRMTNYANSSKGEAIVKGGITHYIPPECITNSSLNMVAQQVDYRGEVFQLGVIAYSVLYEKMPFDGFTWRDLMNNIKKQKPTFRPFISSGEAVPEGILMVLKMMLAKKPAYRLASAFELEKVWKREMTRAYLQRSVGI